MIDSINNSRVSIGNISIGNDLPMVLFCGLNVLEDHALAYQTAEHIANVCQKLGIDWVFKASFDKANRSSIHSYRGAGLDKGLQILADVKQKFAVPVLSDVHEVHQADIVAKVCDVVQLPAFLSRQTDLVVALARTQKPILVKKAQFLAPHEMAHIIQKCQDAGNDKVMLCERGTSFGYNNLVVDMLGIDTMKMLAPVVFDITHSLQKPGGRADSADGRRAQFMPLARAGVATGLAGVFIETHPQPEFAKCDGPSALPLDALQGALTQLYALDNLVKGFEVLDTQ